MNKKAHMKGDNVCIKDTFAVPAVNTQHLYMYVS